MNTVPTGSGSGSGSATLILTVKPCRLIGYNTNSETLSSYRIQH
jgi:hypothetical protein